MSTVNLVGAAELMQVHPKTVQRLINEGKLPAAKIGKRIVLLERDVLDYVEAQVIKQTAERMELPTITRRRVRRRASLSTA